MHIESFEVMRETIAGLIKGNRLRILDVGSQDVQNGKQPTYRDLMRPTWKYTGADIQVGRNVDVVMPGPYELPFPDDSFNAVISGNCLEHTEYPARLIVEMVRVLKPEGVLIVGAPYMDKEHRFPLDCWRFLPDGMRVLLRDAGLKDVKTWRNKIDCWGTGSKGV